MIQNVIFSCLTAGLKNKGDSKSDLKAAELLRLNSPLRCRQRDQNSMLSHGDVGLTGFRESESYDTSAFSEILIFFPV